MLVQHLQQPLTMGQRTRIESRIIVDKTTGAQACALRDQTLPPNGRILPHYHEVEELITILSGTIQATLGNQIIQATADSTIYVPAQLIHELHNNSQEPVRFLAFFPQAHPHTRYTDIETILTAAYEGDLTTIHDLLEADNWLIQAHTAAGDTLLHIAIQYNNRPLLELLVRHSPNWLITNHAGETPQQLAQRLGRETLLFSC